MTGSGKTTFAVRYLLNVPAACRFCFDDLGRIATRLKIRPAYTARELELALADRWVVFNPHKMFPGDVAAAFRFFCEWVYEVSKRGPGKKILLVDELWQWVTPYFIPREFATAVQTGREENVELLTCSQLPHKIHSSVTGQSTELVCFRLQEPKALQCVRDLGGNPAEVSELALGHFIAWNRLSGVKLLGSVF